MTAEQIVYLGLIFVAVFLGMLGVGFVLMRGADVRDRLRAITPESALEKSRNDAPSGPIAQALMRVAEPVAKLATPEEEEKLTQLRARFLHAGLRKASAPIVFFAAKAFLVIALPLAFMTMQSVGVLKVGGNPAFMLLLSCAALGYYVPNVVLNRLIMRRQREIFEAFPDAIDLMIVCVEAGLGLDMAISKAAEEIRLRSTELADELDMISLELRVGASRERALRNFAIRTGLEEVSAFVTMLLQADRFGTSLAESLRVHADSLRTRRRQRAEEAAAKIPLKLLFPLIFFIFPSLLLVLMGPAMIQIYRIMLPTMSGAQ